LVNASKEFHPLVAEKVTESLVKVPVCGVEELTAALVHEDPFEEVIMFTDVVGEQGGFVEASPVPMLEPAYPKEIVAADAIAGTTDQTLLMTPLVIPEPLGCVLETLTEVAEPVTALMVIGEKEEEDAPSGNR
jgi:hypothetical protein